MNTLMSALKSNQLQPQLGDAYLKLQLEFTILSVVLLEHIQEVLVMPVEQITFMPSMPKYFLGLINRRGKVLWLIDLPQMLGLDSLERNVQKYHIAIVQLENMLLGLAVQQVQGVVRLRGDEIESPLNNSVPNLIPYFKGYVVQQEESLLILDTQAITQKLVQHGY